MIIRSGKAHLVASALAVCLLWQPTLTKAEEPGFDFAVLGHSFKAGPDDAPLKHAIQDSNNLHPAFLVATGIKAASESCSDKLYSQRKDLLDASSQPLVISLSASDWANCRNSRGRANAIERLNRLREVFFADDSSLGQRKLSLSRLSSTAKFRSYAENAHWEYGGVLFATVNLPANNNHFLPEAGRNSEFEDRLVANRSWLQRLFAMAQRKKLDGIVLFSDGDVHILEEEESSLLPNFSSKQDGFASPRKQIRLLAKKFEGKVLLVDTQAGSKKTGKKNTQGPKISWKDNLGHISIDSDWATIFVQPGKSPLFEVRERAGKLAPNQSASSQRTSRRLARP
ncbi:MULTISPECIES: hypothetical protein [unclassified Janthinobacterium]|uniref:hypothetical protein n=1 Tax=unclassified Janthinobacterium TaxID=2610881 RepID=UPI0017BA66B5|nr:MULTISPECIES: hypothetical protein [unclassified Janthinobacterium]MBB5367364.1 hypothetical protein [Janthinobacterium sp. K2C7]MBB5380158.1 hypothetical protein [Janthinobacterium sp. K2Li3]MBB5385746.1 hypothetical protein [Janthinobacterium sp. K2E3]